MEDWIEIEGANENEAIDRACSALNTTEAYLYYEVLDSANRTKIRARRREEGEQVSSEAASDVGKQAQEYLSEILHFLDDEVQVDLRETSEAVNLDILGNGTGLFIGKHGQTLEALQHLVAKMCGLDRREGKRLIVDSEKYRSRRKQALEGLARKLAGKVRREKRPMSVEPMNPMERRILHLALQGDPYISTKSVGEGRDRKVVIFPRNYEGSLENARGESREGPSGRRPNGERRGSSRSSRAPSRSDSDRTFRRRSGPPPRKHDSFDTPAVPEGDYLMEEPDAPIVESMESEDGVQSGEE